MSLIKDQSVNLILTDLPFNLTNAKWDSAIIPFPELWNHWKRILKPGGVVLLFAAGKFMIQCINSNPAWYKYDYAWIKNRKGNFANAKRMPLRGHENILCFYSGKPAPVYNPQGLRSTNRKRHEKKMGECYKHSLHSNYIQTVTGYPDTVLNFNCVYKNILHPTEKPVQLLEHLILTHSQPGDLILDCCAGSGSTGMAAKNTGRNYILIEKEEKYVKIILERLK